MERDALEGGVLDPSSSSSALRSSLPSSFDATKTKATTKQRRSMSERLIKQSFLGLSSSKDAAILSRADLTQSLQEERRKKRKLRRLLRRSQRRMRSSRGAEAAAHSDAGTDLSLTSQNHDIVDAAIAVAPQDRVTSFHRRRKHAEQHSTETRRRKHASASSASVAASFAASKKRLRSFHPLPRTRKLTLLGAPSIASSDNFGSNSNPLDRMASDAAIDDDVPTHRWRSDADDEEIRRKSDAASAQDERLAMPDASDDTNSRDSLSERISGRNFDGNYQDSLSEADISRDGAAASHSHHPHRRRGDHQHPSHHRHHQRARSSESPKRDQQHHGKQQQRQQHNNKKQSGNSELSSSSAQRQYQDLLVEKKPVYRCKCEPASSCQISKTSPDGKAWLSCLRRLMTLR